MTKNIFFIIWFIIIVIWVVSYFKYETNKSDTNTLTNSGNTMWNKNESELQLKINSSKSEDTSFKIHNCSEAIVQQYDHASQDKPNKEFLINSKEKISEITDILKKLPEDGEMFISFTSEIELTKLTFLCSENKSYSIEFYWESIKTPWTTFYVEEAPKKEEKKLYEIIKKLISEN